MATKSINGILIEVTDEGYLLDSTKWTREVAMAIAAEESVELTDKHLELIEFIRSKVAAGERLTIRGIGKSGIVDVSSFYRLFPGTPFKKATKIAGVPKPSGCI